MTSRVKIDDGPSYEDLGMARPSDGFSTGYNPNPDSPTAEYPPQQQDYVSRPGDPGWYDNGPEQHQYTHDVPWYNPNPQPEAARPGSPIWYENGPEQHQYTQDVPGYSQHPQRPQVPSFDPNEYGSRMMDWYGAGGRPRESFPEYLSPGRREQPQMAPSQQTQNPSLLYQFLKKKAMFGGF